VPAFSRWLVCVALILLGWGTRAWAQDGLDAGAAFATADAGARREAGDGGVARASDAGAPTDSGTPFAEDDDAGPKPRETDETRSPLEGQAILRTEVVLEDTPWKDIALPKLAAGPGERFSPAVARRLLATALESGRFADGRVFARLETGGVVVLVRLVPRKVVQDITTDFHGAAIAREDVLREADLARDQEITSVAFAGYESKVRILFARHGYPAAKVAISTQPGSDATRVLLRIDVAPGDAQRIGRRVFDVARGASDQAAPLFETYALGSGDVSDETRLEAADLELQNRLRAAGWHAATLFHAVANEHGIVTLRIKIELGIRTLYSFEGNDRFEVAVLTSALGTEQDTDRSPAHLADTLRTFYRARGYLDVEVSQEERPRGADRTLHFKIREHPRVTVGERIYPCFRPQELESRSLEVAPKTEKAVGNEVDSFLEEELPGADFLKAPRQSGLGLTLGNATKLGTRATASELNPNVTYVAETYERAAAHLQELYRADGYLSALVGPVQVVRRRCDPKSPPGTCRPMPLPKTIADACPYDARGLPLPSPDTDAALSCVPDPGRGVECEAHLSLRIPIKLGPRTLLYDATFTGVHAISPSELLTASKLVFGNAASPLKIEDARKLLVEAYQEEGFAYAAVRASLSQSPDHTRARVEFDVSEGEKVLVRSIVIRGNTRTSEALMRRRLALAPGDPYRTSRVRRSQERLATLNTFNSVTIALEDPYVPEKWKTVVITVVERPWFAPELRFGLSTGEGIRGGGELAFRNLFGSAIAFSVAGQISFLPTELVLDEGVRKNFAALPLTARLPTRVTTSLQFPETGLGPLFRGVLDGVFVHDLQRDYYIRKFAAIPSLSYAPRREIRVTVSQSIEYNAVRIFNNDFDTYQRQLVAEGLRDRLNALLVPDGNSVVFAQKIAVAWDRRDNTLDATKGSLVGFSVEHVDALALDPAKSLTEEQLGRDSHFLKFTQTLSGYLPLYKRLRLAAQIRVGANVQLTDRSKTYTDRLFFLGGADSMRAWYPSTFIPQDDADNIEADANKTVAAPTFGPRGSTQVPDPARFTAQSRPVRGGNLLFNPRVELRIPVVSVFETVVFADIGNLWADIRYPFQRREFPMRVSLGTGARLQTPVFPIVFDFGFNPWRRSYDDRSWAFNFAIGLF
jgi:outer membrane protein assembly factor BamA